MSLSGEEMVFGVSFLDVSTGEFLTTQFTDNENFDKIMSEASRMHPAECIMPPELYENKKLTDRMKGLSIAINKFDPEAFDTGNARNVLLKHFGSMTLEGMGCENLPMAVSSSGAALFYA